MKLSKGNSLTLKVFLKANFKIKCYLFPEWIYLSLKFTCEIILSAVENLTLPPFDFWNKWEIKLTNNAAGNQYISVLIL